MYTKMPINITGYPGWKLNNWSVTDSGDDMITRSATSISPSGKSTASRMRKPSMMHTALSNSIATSTVNEASGDRPINPSKVGTIASMLSICLMHSCRNMMPVNRRRNRRDRLL